MLAPTGLADPHLHLFLADDEIDSLVGVTRLINQMRRESLEPVLRPDQPWEMGQVVPRCILHDPADGLYKCWYLAATTNDPSPYRYGIGYATSSDGIEWKKPALDVVRHEDGSPTNIVDLPRGTSARLLFPYLDVPGAAPGERFVGTLYQAGGSAQRGIYRAASSDGIHWTVSTKPLVRAGDRYATAYDPVRDLWMLTTRRAKAAGVLSQREVSLWESTDFQTWAYQGHLLRTDEHDRNNTEFYSMLPLRYGPGILGLLEAYYRAVERMDAQLAWSQDGRQWQRVGHRDPLLARGGEGSWDSHWVVLTNNAPEVVGDRLRFWYAGGSTHHGSKGGHRRAMGLASIRRDGFVSIEGRMDPGFLLTAALDATRPRHLTVNLDAETGTASIEVLSPDGHAVEGYSVEDCRLSEQDGVAVDVSWRGGRVVPPQAEGRVHLKFNLRNASLYSYRWVPADEADR
ncbi:MAG: hypothetical protein CL878_00080 [Dehalococcoidia bacterium]|nr:hypothetical protein [Dehalococcoidia bacterium]